ncbi:MAG: EscU/YscU/HrcU family type III secretion system export apparatus switch protein [Pseudomonadota bacterium]
MSGSEERLLKPSARKLRKAREKGQIPMQRDTRLLVVTMGGLLFLWTSLDDVADHFMDSAAYAIALLQDPSRSYDEIIARSAAAGIRILGKLVAILVGLLIVSSIVLNRGLVFSFDPLTPRLSHLDPAEGLKRIFSLRTLADLGKSLLRLAFAIVGIWLVLRHLGSALLYAPRCGMPCLLDVTLMLAALVLLVIVVAAVIVAVLDLPLQARLFERDQKMTKSEAKAENKDMNGAPEIRTALRRLRREAAADRGGKLGVTRATLVVAGDDEAVAIRYVKAEFGIPVIVAKIRGSDRMDALGNQTTALSLPVFHDADLTRRILRGARAGRPIRPTEYSDTARLIQLVQ